MDFREQHVKKSSELIGNNVIVQNIINNHLTKKITTCRVVFIYCMKFLHSSPSSTLHHIYSYIVDNNRI